MKSNMQWHGAFSLIMVVVCFAAYSQDSSTEVRDRFDKGQVISKETDSETVDAGNSRLHSSPNIDAVEEEIRIMAKVLEDSIDNAGIEDWRSARGVGPVITSRHGGHIRGRYVPSVGVLFTVPVAFPIRSEAEYNVEDSSEETGPPDLWKKHERSSAKYPLRFNKTVASTGTDSEVRVISPDGVVIRESIVVDEPKKKSGHSGQSAGSSSTATATSTSDGRIAVKFKQGRGGGGFGWGGGGGGRAGRSDDELIFLDTHHAPSRPKYNEATVKKLRSTLLETVAKYGHRIEHLGQEDRIFVIVESGRRGLWGGIPVLGHMYKGSVTSIPASGPSTARYQIVVRKRDLREPTTAKALTGKIEETEY